MNATEISSGKPSETSADLELAFDVGHSSIGWAVLRSVGRASSRANTPSLNLLGCGVVTFGADDCLASKRRDYRRQRRHVRSTRQRIARMERLLAHLGVLTPEQLAAKHQQAGGHSAPWLLAARALASNGDPKFLLDWSHLWDVLRWYAHNRGYDGNRRWSQNASTVEFDEKELEKRANDETLTEEERKDAKYLKEAKGLMREHGTRTMAETVCRVMGLDPFGSAQASQVYLKGKRAAFPREVVEKEVRRLFDAHTRKLPAVNDAFLKTLFQDWRAVAVPELDLPKRYQGGLLFGQLVPRFDNRIISKCPISGQKVPSKNCPEFLRFRWAMQLANIRVARAGERDLRPLSADERKTVDALMRQEGSLTPKELIKSVRDATGCQRDNLDTMLMHPDAKEALLLDPVQRLVRGDKLRTLWPCLAPRVQKRARDLWQRGKAVSLAELRELSRKLGESTEALEAEVNRMLDAANTRKNRKQAPLTREGVMNAKHHVPKLEGRAAYARPLLIQAHDEVMAGKHPKEEGGCLFITEEMRLAQLRRELAEQTNNHLVRHRLLILERLLKDLIADPAFANGDKARVARMTIEVNRDLREMSGKDSVAKKDELRAKLGNIRAVEQYVLDRLPEQYHSRVGTYLRKARVADDLDWHCPYTGEMIQPIHLLNGTVDLDHIVPYSLRPSNSLDSLVVTFSTVNRMKGKRTATQFMKEMSGQPVAYRDENGRIEKVDGMPGLSLLQFKEFTARIQRLPIRKSREHGQDAERRIRRKRLLELETYEEKEFLPRDLTTTSQLVRLGAQMLKRSFPGQDKQPQVVSLPGSVTGTVRKGWNLLGCLSLAAPQVVEADGTVKTKTEIRDLTHLHHALDACVLGLAAHRLPNNGGLWELMLKRNLSEQDKQLLRATGQFDFDSEGRFGLKELPGEIKEQIRQRLAEKRVVQHIPADMSGLGKRIRQNTTGILKVLSPSGDVLWDKEKNTDAELEAVRKQVALAKDLNEYRLELTAPVGEDDGDGESSKKTKKPVIKAASHVLGFLPASGKGKLMQQRGVRELRDNFGVAILDHAPEGEEKFVIIPWHKVYVRIHKGFPARDGRPEEKSLVARNGGRLPRILRNGQLIRVSKGTHQGTWRVFSAKNNADGIALALGKPDALTYDKAKQNVKLRQLLKDGMVALRTSFAGAPACPTPSSA